MNKIISTLLLIFFGISCAAQKIAEKNIEKEVQNEKVTIVSDLGDNTKSYIQKSETLTQFQKQSLLILFEKSQIENKNLSEEIAKVKLVYLKTILEPKINEREATILSRKLRKLSKSRLEADFKTFADARKIIDPLKELRDREFLYNSFMLRRNYYW
jgi:hypothetical protein